MRQKFFAVLNSDNPNVGEMKIYGVIGSYWDDNTANAFVSAFNSLEKTCERINIHINSPGGSVHEGLPVCNAIKASVRDVHTYVDGIAYSMGAMIAISAKKGNVHMATGSLLMLHSVSTWTHGNAQHLRDEADVLDKYDDVLGNLIVGRTGKSLADVKAEYMDHKDHYFTPAEAKAEGLIDVIEAYEATDVPDDAQNMSYGQVAAWYEANADEPNEGFMQKILGRVKSALGGESNNSKDMFGNKFSKLGALAKVAAGSVTDEQLAEVNAEIVAAGVQGVTVVLDSELEEKTGLLTTLESDKTTLQTKVTDLEGQVSTKDARIAELEKEVKDLGGKPAETPAAVVTDKTDAPGTGDDNEAKDLYSSVDAEADKLFGKK